MNDIVIGREEKDKKRLGSKGTVFIGKHYIQMGRTSSLSNKVMLDVTRSHVVFICGKRGGGKCLTGDTEIILGDGSLKKIRDLEFDDHTIMSLDLNLKINPKEKDAFFEREVYEILEVTLGTGKKIRCTPEHPLLSLYGWEEAQDLNIGNKIATPKILPVFGEYDVEEKEVKKISYNLGVNKKDESIKKEIEMLNFKEEKLTEVPEEIFKLPRYKLAVFLNRVMSCDATISKEDEWVINYKNKSERITKQIQHLLLRFGIISSFVKKRYNYLLIEDGFVKNYLENIGFFGAKEKPQKVALRETAYEVEQLDIPEELLDFFDPEDWEVLGKNFVVKNNNYNYKEISETQHKQFISKLIESDIYWDEIVKLEKIYKKTKVYDLTVPETNNFIANNIIVHNSYTMGVIAEGVSELPEEVKNNISIIILDTMGVYWTMKYPNKQDKQLLDEWDLEGKSLDVKIFTPYKYHEEYKEKNIPTDMPFAIKPSELSGQDWNQTFSIKPEEPIGVLIEKVINDLQEEGIDFDIDDIVNRISKETDYEKHVLNAAKNLFENSKGWGLFNKDATTLKEVAVAGQVSVLDVSCYATMPGSWNVKNLVIGLIAQKLFVQRMIARKEEEFGAVHKSANPYSDDAETKQEFPMVWLVIDEAHEFLPVKGKTLATDPLVTILREGRQPGISLILATQQPGKIHTDVMTQSDTVIAHRITAKMDTDALGTLMQSYMREGLVQQLDNLPREKGSAIIFDDTNEKMYPIRIRPRFTWHGGGAPSALKERED
ncbi:MAG: LAGLIDADG family homing endonuclease [Candidatus Woesearchaeota archaeon]